MGRLAGLTLHSLAGVPIHDPTNTFKLYSREFLDSIAIESHAEFELAIELSVKAALDGRMMAEVPTAWRDRSGIESRFRSRARLVQYLRWCVFALRGRFHLRNPRSGVTRHRGS